MDMSPSAARIRDVAVNHFAHHGYDGASLNVIAATAGMRKASLYSHFSSKDDLFASVLDYAAASEKAHATATFASDQAPLRGAAYLAEIADRYTQHDTLRFLLRAAYAPPIPMREQVIARHRDVLDHVATLFSSRLAVEETAREQLTDCYLGIVDSVHVEAVFGELALLERRRTAMWTMLKQFAGTTISGETASPILEQGQ